MKAPRGTPSWKANVGEGRRRGREERARRARRELRDLAVLAASDTVPARIAPFLEAAGREGSDLLDALGGPERVSPQRRALIEDAARLGLVMRSLLVAFVQGGGIDGELGSRLATLASARRANLSALGLDRFAEDVHDLTSYLERRTAQKPAGAPIDAEPAQDRAGEAIDVQPVREPAPVADASAGASAAPERHAETVGAQDREEPAP